MSEWEVMGVLIAVVGFLATLIKPIVKLTSSVTKLTTVVERLSEDTEEQKNRSAEVHSRLWAHNDAQDERLNDHETRITLLERNE